MSEALKCRNCGVDIPSNAPFGHCPKCLFELGFLTSAPASTASTPLATGRVHRFGDYELAEQIGRGGMGVVFKARQIRLDRWVALKMISAGELASPDVVQRFKVETEASAQLCHPNIVPTYDVGEFEGHHYFTMKLIEGTSLDQLISKFGFQDGKDLSPGPPSKPVQKRIAQLMAKVARAVHYAHQRGILHRDLKPSNILLDAQGEPHLTDFGVAKIVARTSGPTLSGAVIGTPTYMAPEQASGGTKHVTTAADVYSLGAILYQLLTGRPPFQAETCLELLRRTVECEPTRPSSVNHRIDRDLEVISLKCLEKDPQRRYASAEAFAQELERWLRHEPILARPSSAWERGRKWVKRKPAFAALLVVCAVVLGGSGGGVLWHNGQLNERLRLSFIEQARSERLRNNRERALQLISEAARLKRDSLLREEAIQVVSQPGFRLVHDLPFFYATIVQFSPDGKLLAAGGLIHHWRRTDPKILSVWEMPSGKLLGETEWDDAAGPFVFSPTAPILAVPKTNGMIELWEPRTGKEILSVKGAGALLFSPDGCRLAIADTNAIRVINVFNGQEERSRSPAALVTFLSGDQLLIHDANRLVRWNVASGRESVVTSEKAYPLAVSADNRIAALRGGTLDQPRDFVDLVDLLTGNRIRVLPEIGTAPLKSRLSADGTLLAYPDRADPTLIRIWDSRIGKPRRSLSKAGSIFRPNLPNSNSIAAAQLDAASPSCPYTANFNRGGLLFACETLSGSNEAVTIWSVDAGQEISVLQASILPSWSPDGRFLATVAWGMIRRPDRDIGEAHGFVRVKVWEFLGGAKIYPFSETIYSLAFSPDGRQFAVNGTLCHITREGESVVLDPVMEKTPGNWITFCANGTVWASLHGRNWENEWEKKPIALWRLAPDKKELVIPNPGVTGSFAFNSDGTRLLVACQGTQRTNQDASLDGLDHFQVWDLSVGKNVALWNRGWGPKKSFGCGPTIFSPDGERIASSAFTHRGFEILNAADGKRLHRLNEARGPTRLERFLVRFKLKGRVGRPEYGRVVTAAFSPDRRYVFTAGSEYYRPSRPHEAALVTIHEVESGREVAMCRGDTAVAICLAISPDGRLLASAGTDNTVRLWEVPSGRELARWQAHDSWVTALAFSPDGVTLASGCSDGTVKFWNLPFIRRELSALKLDW